jgi:hypothetical protein
MSRDITWSRLGESNPRPTNYESQAGSLRCSHLDRPSPQTCEWAHGRPVLRLLDWLLTGRSRNHRSPPDGTPMPGSSPAATSSWTVESPPPTGSANWLRSRRALGLTASCGCVTSALSGEPAQHIWARLPLLNGPGASGGVPHGVSVLSSRTTSKRRGRPPDGSVPFAAQLPSGQCLLLLP